VVTELQSEIARLEMQRAGLLKEYTTQAPEVTAVDAQIASARTRIQSELGKVLSEQQEAVNPVYEETLQQYAGLKAQVLAQGARVEGLDNDIRSEAQALRILPEKQLQLAELMRNASELEKTYTMLDAKYQELRVQEAAVLPNARVVD